LMTMSVQLIIPSSELPNIGEKKPPPPAADANNKPSKGVYRKRKLPKKIAVVASDDSEDDSSPAVEDGLTKIKRARRARRRPHKGYYEMTDRERVRLEERERQRTDRIKERMRAKGHMMAPYNTTEFILEDTSDDAVVRRLDAALTDSTENLFTESPTRMRARDSSLSLDSDEGYFYSSPEDEEEFVSREFSKDYENGNVDRLSRMEKGSLIHEYLGMERKVERLEKRLEEINQREAMNALTGEVDYEFHRGEVPMEPETATKIKVFQAEINRLLRENKSLNFENSTLKRRLRNYSSSSSASSSSSSDSSSSSSSSSEDEQEIQQLLEDNIQQLLEDKPGGRTEDTGYESTQSKENTPEPETTTEKSM